MEVNENNTIQPEQPKISKVYLVDGCEVVVRRVFDKTGSGILEQLLSLLLDLIEKSEDTTLNN